MAGPVESVDGGLGFAAVGEAERDRAIRVLVSAFEDDPVERWLYPDDAVYREHFPAFIAAFGGDAFHDQTVWRLGDFDAVAFWFAPGREPDGDAVVRVLVETTAEHLHADSFATWSRWPRGIPGRTGTCRGLECSATSTDTDSGRISCATAWRSWTRAGLPAYLETPNPRTVPFYERAGFTVTGTAQAGACPPITMMQRAGRPRHSATAGPR